MDRLHSSSASVEGPILQGNPIGEPLDWFSFNIFSVSLCRKSKASAWLFAPGSGHSGHGGGPGTGSGGALAKLEFQARPAGNREESRGTSPIHSRLLSRKPPETRGKRLVFEKNDG